MKPNKLPHSFKKAAEYLSSLNLQSRYPSEVYAKYSKLGKVKAVEQTQSNKKATS